jgi:restriction endonuclease Mrr
MPIPTQNVIAGPLLSVIHGAGGSIKTNEAYDLVAAHFPDMTLEERQQELDNGTNQFNNRVQWARQKLVDEGFIDGSVRGVWTLTTEGRQAALNGFTSDESGLSSYLLTWNQAHSPWPEMIAHISKLAAGQKAFNRWSTGNSKNVSVGDKFFLLKQGDEPRGVIGHGTVLTDVFQEPHWDHERAAKGDSANYVDVQFETLIDPNVIIPFSPADSTDDYLRKANWTPYASGMRINDEVATILLRYWLAHIEHQGQAMPSAASSAPPSECITPSSRVSLLSLVETHHTRTKIQIREFLMDMNPYQFEELSAQLMRLMGFRNVVVTKRSNDGGIDGHGQLKLGIVSAKAAFQCKRWAKSIGRPDIDAFRGATQGNYDHAIFITTSRFTEEAAQAATRTGCIPIILLDGEAMVELMIEKGLGVTNKPLSIPVVDENFFVSHEESPDS